MKRFFSIFLIIGMALSVFADEVVFKTKAPNQVIAGKPFQISFSVNQQGRDLRAPQFTDFDVLSGPYTSTSSSTSYVNGQRTSTFEQTYTYTLLATRAGTYTIGPATIKVNGKDVQSNGVRIEVLPEDKQPQQSGQSGYSGQSNQGSQQGEIFVRTIASKTKVQEQEAIALTYKLYFANVEGLQLTNNIKLPEFTGFLKQEIEQKNLQAELEHYNGRNYQTAELVRYVLFPQRSGDITIEPANFEFMTQVRVRQRVRSIFDDYFDSYTNVPRHATAPAVTIHVDPLPSGKPAGFSGGVGSFTLNSTITKTEMKVNDAFTITLEISGQGNMKLLKTPAIDWPEGFEVYDPQVKNNFNITKTGFKGSKVIEYPVIARNAGEYTIPAVTFSYYDTQEHSYKTLSTPDYTIHVARGAGEAASDSNQPAVVNYSHTQKEDIKQLGSDIRYIDLSGNWQKHQQRGFIEYGSMEFWLCFLLPLGIAILLLIILRKRIKENADLARVRYKRANKVAQKRLKAARAALKANDKDAFYTEIERAAWTYLSDRLSIPTADLNKDNITALLVQKNVSDALIAKVMNVLSTAEFARYAPTTDHAMDDLYRDTTTLINELEEQKL